MKKSTVFISLFTGLLFFLITVLFLTPEAFALNWDDFTQSMNDAFSKKNVFTTNNLILLTIVLIITVSLILIIRFDTIRTDEIRRKAYQEVRQELLAKKALAKSDNRSWFRMPVQMQFKWQHWPEELYVKPKKFSGLVLDISGGGMLFQTTELLNVQDEIKLWLTIDKSPIELIAQVIRIQEKLNESESKEYLIGVKFIDIREGTRDKIIAWILKSQTEFMTLHDEEILTEEASTVEEKVITDDNAASTHEEETDIKDTSLYPQASFSGILLENQVVLLIKLENQEPRQLNGKIINTVKNNSQTTITLEINE